MAQYGQYLGTYDPKKQEIYNAISKFFQYPPVYKLKDVGNFSMYATKIYGQLSREFRYIFAFVPMDDKPPGFPDKLSDICWISLQTRTVPEDYPIEPHFYKPVRGGILDTAINKISSNREASTYECPTLDIVVTLLNKPKDETLYNQKGTVIQALETYYTVITFKE